MRTFVLRCSAVFSFVLLTLTSSTQAQLPEGWRELPVKEFVKQTRVLYEKGELEGSFLKEVQEHGASILSQTNFMTTDLDYQTLDALHWGGEDIISNEVKQNIYDALKNREVDWTDQPYEEMRAKNFMMWRAGFSFADRAKMAQGWVDAGGKISDVWDGDRAFAKYFFSDPEIIDGKFSIQWTGKITAPQTGSYKLSISPINVNAIHNANNARYYVQQTMNVSVAGQQIINATPENWEYEGASVNLTANQPVNLQVDLIVDSKVLPSNVLHAFLYWEGPGIVKSVVSAEHLILPDGSGNGLSAKYSWESEGNPIVRNRTDSEISFVWATGNIPVATESTLPVATNNELWGHTMDQEYLTTLENSGEIHPLLVDSNSSAGGMSLSERKALLNEFLGRPVLLDALNPRKILDLYRAYRYGNEDLALDIFGLWALRKPDGICPIPGNINSPGIDLNGRNNFREMAICVTQEFPEHASRLQNLYLELEDGRCCLPVAHTLGYSYQSQGKLSDWIEFLDAKLEDNSVTGDKRVNWLLARAHAHEIRLGPKKPYVIIKERFMDSRGIIEEASLVAETVEVKARVAKELAARLNMIRKFDDARALLQQVEGSAPAELVSKISEWKKEIDATEEKHELFQIEQAKVAKEKYIKSLKARQSKAASSGNTEAANRYDALIQAAEAQ